MLRLKQYAGFRGIPPIRLVETAIGGDISEDDLVGELGDISVSLVGGSLARPRRFESREKPSCVPRATHDCQDILL